MEPEVVEDSSKTFVDVNFVPPSETKGSLDASSFNDTLIDTNLEENLNLMNEISKFSLRKKKKKFYPISEKENASSMETAKDSIVLDNFSKATTESTDADNLTFNFTKKKKKKQFGKVEKDLIKRNSVTSEENEILENTPPVSDKLSTFTDSEYTYEYLLCRFYTVAELDLPHIDQDSFMKIVLQPPRVFRVGSKRTVFANVGDICRSLHRPPEHVISYIFVELGTCGSVDGNNHLIIKGRFQQNQISNIIKRYVMEYVRCATCNSFNTIIQKRIRLHFLICENCNSQRSVVSIKSGFQAITAKRSALRAKS